MVEFCLSLPGTNAAIERVLSLMNDVWKTRIITETVKTFELVEQILTFLLLTYLTLHTLLVTYQQRV